MDKKEMIQKMRYNKPDEFALSHTIDEESFMEGYESAKSDMIKIIENEIKSI